MTRLSINGDRLQQSLEEINQIGATPGGGCCRLALSDEDKHARDLFVQWCKAAGAEVKVDCFGNIFAIRPGLGPNRKVILTGSHLDTQPHGGRLDGIYGVLAGLEVLRTLQESNTQTDFDVAVVNWTNEEGVRFQPGLTGSSGFTGQLSHDAIWDLSSTEGSTFKFDLMRIGYFGVPMNDLTIGAYIETHIEQGPILEEKAVSIGVVQGIQEVRWFEVTVEGSDRHAGTTPMHLRQDSFAAVAEMVSTLRTIALSMNKELRFTVGRVHVSPGSPNTVPGLSSFTIDLRHPESDVLDTFVSEIERVFEEVDARHGVHSQIKQTMHVPAVHFDQHCVEVVKSSAIKAGFSSIPIVSGAMHDASRVSAIAPTAMIFVPSRDGISHHESEWTDPQHLTAGGQVLLESILALAGERR
ncbi:M20 family metallo-hydrolase [Pseudomonas sp. DWRC2-2]|uniref:M20 family metallo-hydrolase n=1 Tax=Pseudomonas sp. DWRC2-2 TaxID=2804567 RepID=UPI003CF9A987